MKNLIVADALIMVMIASISTVYAVSNSHHDDNSNADLEMDKFQENHSPSKETKKSVNKA